MKYLSIVLLLTLCGYSAYPQSHEPYIYAEAGGGDGTYGMAKLALNTIFAGHHVISLSYCYASHRAPDIPSDFNPNGLFGPSWPQQSLSVFGISYGYVFFTNSSRVRFTVKAGIADDAVSTPTDFALIPLSTWFSEPSQYTYSFKNDVVLGIVLDPTVEFPLSRGFGFSLGLYANINPVSSVFGVNTCMIFGRLKGKRRRV